MLTSKERAKLKSEAARHDAIFQIGKSSITPAQIEGISEALTKRELVKISMLKSCETDIDELMTTLAARLKAEPVMTIGNKIILYRFSKELKCHILQ